MKQTTFNFAGIHRGAYRTLPLAVSVAAYGIMFGVLARGVGMSWLEATLMSALVGAGGSQFVALEMWWSPLPVRTIILGTLLVNSRHLLMGLSLGPWLQHLPKTRVYGLAALLSDESWALTMQEFSKGETTPGVLLGSGLVLLSSWICSTMVGHILGAVIPSPEIWGLDFGFTGVFSALLVRRWGGRLSIFPWAAAAGVALLAFYWLPGQWYILLGGLAGGLVGAMRDGS